MLMVSRSLTNPVKQHIEIIKRKCARNGIKRHQGSAAMATNVSSSTLKLTILSRHKWLQIAMLPILVFHHRQLNNWLIRGQKQKHKHKIWIYFLQNKRLRLYSHNPAFSIISHSKKQQAPKQKIKKVLRPISTMKLNKTYKMKFWIAVLTQIHRIQDAKTAKEKNSLPKILPMWAPELWKGSVFVFLKKLQHRNLVKVVNSHHKWAHFWK